jgi:hypothetical protein
MSKTEIKAKGGSLKGLNDLNELNKSLIEKSNEIKQTRLIIETEVSELNQLDQKEKSNTETKKRKRRRIKKAESKLTKLAKKSHDLVDAKEKTRINALAESINYPITDCKHMNVLEFEKHKKDVQFKALQYYEDFASLACAGIIEVAGGLEQLPYGDGCQERLLAHSPNIKDKLNRIFVHMAKDSINIDKFINPWTALGLSVGVPLMSTFAVNFMNSRKESKKKKTITKEEFVEEGKKALENINDMVAKKNPEPENNIKILSKDIKKSCGLSNQPMMSPIQAQFSG